MSGIIRDKVSFLIKSLPKTVRLAFNPLNESITEFLASSDTNDSLINQLINYAKTKKIELDYQNLAKITFPHHLCCHFRIFDNKKLIKSGNDLSQIRTELNPVLDKLVVKQSAGVQINNLFGFIPEFTNLGNKVELGKINGYYSLIVEKDGSITYGVVSKIEQARLSTRRGFISLIKLQLKDQLKYLQSRKLPDFMKISLCFSEFYTKDKLSETIANYIINQAISDALADKLPETEVIYNQLVSDSRQNISKLTLELNNTLSKTAAFYQQIKQQIENHPLAEEIEIQLEDLFYENFLNYTKWQHLINFPRYLQAILTRVERYTKSPARDTINANEISSIYDKWYNYVDKLESMHKVVKSELYDFRYKIEELRISLFAEGLKTLYPVSAKRLLGKLEQLYLEHLTA